MPSMDAAQPEDASIKALVSSRVPSVEDKEKAEWRSELTGQILKAGLLMTLNIRLNLAIGIHAGLRELQI